MKMLHTSKPSYSNDGKIAGVFVWRDNGPKNFFSVNVRDARSANAQYGLTLRQSVQKAALEMFKLLENSMLSNAQSLFVSINLNDR